MGRPILIEGPAGVGKTELAKTLSEVTGRPLTRLQCYEGLDEGKALYEWKYAKQLLQRLEQQRRGSGPRQGSGGPASTPGCPPGMRLDGWVRARPDGLQERLPPARCRLH